MNHDDKLLSDIASGKPLAADQLIGLDAAAADEIGWTLLRYAIEHQRFDNVELLLRHGWNPDDRSFRVPLLHHAIDIELSSEDDLNLSTRSLRALLGAGASTSAVDADGRTAAQFAAWRGWSDVVGLLL